MRIYNAKQIFKCIRTNAKKVASVQNLKLPFLLIYPLPTTRTYIHLLQSLLIQQMLYNEFNIIYHLFIISHSQNIKISYGDFYDTTMYRIGVVKTLGKITEFILFKHVERKLGKYDIKMVHFIPGRLRLQSLQWKTNVTLVEKLVKELQAQPFVFSVQPTPVTGSLVITYDAAYLTNIEELDSWFRVLDQVYRTEYMK